MGRDKRGTADGVQALALSVAMVVVGLGAVFVGVSDTLVEVAVMVGIALAVPVALVGSVYLSARFEEVTA